MLQTCERSDCHFSFSKITSLSHVAEHHHKWLEIEGIHARRPSIVFFLHTLYSFSVILLAKCQTSYWWLICAQCWRRYAVTYKRHNQRCDHNLGNSFVHLSYCVHLKSAKCFYLGASVCSNHSDGHICIHKSF